jgi:hypothetical protein
LVEQTRGLTPEESQLDAIAGAIVDGVAEDRSETQEARHEGQVDRRAGPGRERAHGEK